MLAQQHKGVKKENVFAYELQKNKLEEAKKYENDQYVLNVNYDFLLVFRFFSGSKKVDFGENFS